MFKIINMKEKMHLILRNVIEFRISYKKHVLISLCNQKVIYFKTIITLFSPICNQLIQSIRDLHNRSIN